MIKLGIIGATGYTGIELYRLASNHPDIAIVFATSEQYTGNHVSEVFPHIDPFADTILSWKDWVTIPINRRTPKNKQLVTIPKEGALDKFMS